MTLGLQDVLVLQNDDDRPQVVAGIEVPARTKLSIPFPRATDFELACSVHPSGKLTISVREPPAPGWERPRWRLARSVGWEARKSGKVAGSQPFLYTSESPMGPIDSTSSKRSAIRVSVLLLLALVSFALVLEGSQPVHSHEDGVPGLYNAECPLVELSAVHVNGWIPVPATIASPTSVVLPVVVTAVGWIPSPSLSLADSRAPPLA